MSEVETTSLSTKAYEPLQPGEAYPPLIASESKIPELSWRSVGWGVFFWRGRLERACRARAASSVVIGSAVIRA